MRPVSTFDGAPDRGLKSVQRGGGAVIYEVVFGRCRSDVEPSVISFKDIDESERRDRSHTAYLIVTVIHLGLIGIAGISFLPAEPMDTVPEQGMAVELVSPIEGSAAQQSQPMVTGGAEARGPMRTPVAGPATKSPVQAAPAPEVTSKADVATAATSTPTFAAGQATPPSRELPPIAGAAVSGASVVSVDETRWEAAILERIEKRLRYPKRALKDAQEDNVILRLIIDRQGKLVRQEIVKSKGHSLLDAEVIALAKRASPYPQPPATVPGETVSLLVPVEFVLKDKK